MSIADAMRVIALEHRVVDLAEGNRVLLARVSALEDHLVDFQAAVEARQALAIAAATHLIPAPQQPSGTPVRDADACPSCARRREQAQVRLRRHRAKITAVNGETLEVATA